MSRTADDVFSKTMSLTDNLDDNGNYDYDDTAEYKNRTLFILNSIIGQCYPYSNTFTEASEAGKRAIIDPILEWTDEINLDDYICDDILPYWLGYLLLIDENYDLAMELKRHYEEAFARLIAGKDKATTGKTLRKDVYGWGSYNLTSWW